MTPKIYHHYSSDHLPHSAEIIVPYLMQLFSPASVVDVGCGPGQWLSVFKQNGVLRVMGIDGKHVPTDKRMIGPSEFAEFDLNDCRDFVAKEKYDLLLSLEVAEHLTTDKAEAFINMISQLSNNIVFSAAIPGQTGENHFNEQYPDYWFRLFATKGYAVLDPFRKKYWNSDVNWWYSQNMYLMVKGPVPISLQQYVWDNNVYVHPKLLEMYVSMQARQTIPLFAKIKNKLRRIVPGY